MRDFIISKFLWDSGLHKDFEENDIDYTLGTHQKNSIRLSVELQHASKAYSLIRSRSHGNREAE